MGRCNVTKTITPESALRYACRVIAHVNKKEENSEGKMRKTTIGMIKVSGLIQNREKQFDPMLAWEMFHNIYHVYSEINNKEETNAALLLTSM